LNAANVAALGEDDMRNALSMIGCISLFSLVACGGISESLTDPSLDAGDADDAGVDTLEDGGKIVDRDGAAKQDASVIGVDGGPKGAAVIDPLAMGEAWTYDVTVVGDFPECNTGTYVSSVSQTETLDGKNAFLVGSFCPSLGSYWYANDGDLTYEYASGQWSVGLDTPLQAGHSWSVNSQSFTWYAANSITVPAGTFSDCWEARENSSTESYSIFLCRGVGPVHWAYRDGFGDGYDAVLHSKNF
jgi:hypothetical protein